MIDVGQAILELETLNDSFDTPIYEIGVAIKMMKMWRMLRSEYGGLMIKFPSHTEDVSEYMDEIEEKFFPSIIHQTLKVAIQGKDDKTLHRIRDIIKSVGGVNEVRL